MVAASASPALADDLPPQLPTAEEMARLQSDLASSLKQVQAGQQNLDQAIRKFEAAESALDAARDRLKSLDGPIAQTALRQQQMEAQLVLAQKQINHRAASAYRRQGMNMVTVVFQIKSFRQFLTWLGLFKSVAAADSKSLATVANLRSEANKAQTQLQDQKKARAAEVAEITRQESELDKQKGQFSAALAGLGRQFDSIKADIAKRKSGFAFPVEAPYSYVDTFGAPRQEGSPLAHRHEGIDIFAAKGTPMLAVVDGVIEHVGEASLGGTKLWLRSPGDNWTYYYAHLDGYAPGIAEGLHVSKGQVVGYVGNTGDARTTPPHLHFETHVPPAAGESGPYPVGPAINAYPILRRVDPLAKQ